MCWLHFLPHKTLAKLIFGIPWTIPCLHPCSLASTPLLLLLSWDNVMLLCTSPPPRAPSMTSVNQSKWWSTQMNIAPWCYQWSKSSMCMIFVQRLTRCQRHTNPILRCKRDAMKRLPVIMESQGDSVLQQYRIWLDAVGWFISNAYKAVLHLKYHQFSCFTVSQQRIVFNKKEWQNPCLSYMFSIGSDSSAICQTEIEKKVNVWNNLFKKFGCLIFFSFPCWCVTGQLTTRWPQREPQKKTFIWRHPCEKQHCAVFTSSWMLVRVTFV